MRIRRGSEMTLRIMTVDLEGDLDSKETRSLEKVVPKLLDLFEKRQIKATFFVVSELLHAHKELILEIQSKGHEIASHSQSHSFLSTQNSLQEIGGSRREFLSFGIEVSGFRAPSYTTANSHFTDLKQSGYHYDSSLAVFWPGRYKNLWLGFRPRPFVQKFQDSTGMRQSSIVELPMPTFLWPFINSGLSYLKLFDPISRLFPLQYMFYLHPWEFLERSDLPSAGVLGSLLQRNCGALAWRLFEKFLDRCERRGTEWVTCKEYVQRKGLGK